MLSTDGFKRSKRMAQLLAGPAGKQSFVYHADIKRQWEWSYSSTKIVELIGSQSGPAERLFDVKAALGALSDEETSFAETFSAFYDDLAALLTSVAAPVNCQSDIYETIFDRRQIAPLIKAPCCILDIGPGAGRHMAAAFLGNGADQTTYVGVESVGMCYTIQNLAASLIRMRSRDVKFFDDVDGQFARQDLPPIDRSNGPAIYLLPLWAGQKLPDRCFDLIICNYVLDELPGEDFQRVVRILGRCLADDGVIYCRGSQQRAMLKDMYLYGYGTSHGIDITRAILDEGMKVTSCELIAGELTRTFARRKCGARPVAGGKLVSLTQDIPLLEAVQAQFIRDNITEIVSAGQKVAIWGDRGYEHYRKFIEPCAGNMKVLAFTHREAAGNAVTDFDGNEVPPEQAIKLNPDKIIIASMRHKSILRQIRERCQPGQFQAVRHFNYPIAFAYRDMPEM